MLSNQQLLRPNAPRNLKAENIAASSADLSWDSVQGAKSYVIRYGVGSAAADRLHYSKTPSFTLNDTVFAGTLAGLELHVFIQSFSKTYTGADEIEQANNAMKDNADVWSEMLTVNFPATKTVTEMKAVLDGKGIEYSKTAKKAELDQLLNENGGG